MATFSSEIIQEALKKIDNNPYLINGRKSLEYDLVHEGKSYPPILVLSEANKILGGKELTLNDFGNSVRRPFEILRSLGFEVKNKGGESLGAEVIKPRIWIEKTIVQGREDRINGEYSLGKRLWSPIRDRRGADIYSLMRKISPGDIVLHLTDNYAITGVSKVKSSFKEGQGVLGSEWEGPAYIVDLEDYMKINALPRDAFLQEKYRDVLLQIKSKSRVFYNSELNLNQGAYITECPLELANLVNLEYFSRNNNYIPFLPLPTVNIQNESPAPNRKFEISGFKFAIKEANLFFSSRIISRYISALLTKPFVILTGLSGSGKTKLAHAFAKWISENENQICIVPVGADWTNREPLLGFPNALDQGKYVFPDNGALNLILEARKEENQQKPYFLILDEMNLSHVERYFADFLSTMESGEAIPLRSDFINNLYEERVPSKIKLPKNLFIIGTVNVDETTYMFSPKVLDRANVIEFRITHNEIQQYLQNYKPINYTLLNGVGASMASSFVQMANGPSYDFNNGQELKDKLIEFFKELQKLSSEFGYRTASEILRFGSIVNQIEPSWQIDEILDAAVMQKLLPKVHGSRRKLEPVLKRLAELCFSDKVNIENVLLQDEESDLESLRFPLSFEKIKRMHRGLVHNGFTSYAEA
jgi:5-methylcytosine-specific restriction enzyme B